MREPSPSAIIRNSLAELKHLSDTFAGELPTLRDAITCLQERLAASEAGRERDQAALRLAWTWFDGGAGEHMTDHDRRVADAISAALAAAPAEPAQPARDDVLEEAAKVAEGRATLWRGWSGPCAGALEDECVDTANAIRALKRQDQQRGG